MVSNPMEMEPKKTIFTITDEVTAARNTKDQEKERAAILEFIDHILTGKETECANLNRCGPKVFPYPNYRWQKFSPSCPSCNAAAMENLKRWRNNFLPNKPEVLIGKLWDFEAGQVLIDPIGVQATIKGFAQDKTAAILTQEGKDIRLSRQELNTYKVFVPEVPAVQEEPAKDTEEAPPVETETEKEQQPKEPLKGQEAPPIQPAPEKQKKPKKGKSEE